jgi:hypothetical protein
MIFAILTIRAIALGNRSIVNEREDSSVNTR